MGLDTQDKKADERVRPQDLTRAALGRLAEQNKGEFMRKGYPRMAEQGIPGKVLRKKPFLPSSPESRRKLLQSVRNLEEDPNGPMELTLDPKRLPWDSSIIRSNGKMVLRIPLSGTAARFELGGSMSKRAGNFTQTSTGNGLELNESILGHLEIPLDEGWFSSTTAGIFGKFHEGNLDAGILVSGLTFSQKIRGFPGRTTVSFQAGRTFTPGGTFGQSLLFAGQGLPWGLRASVFKFFGLVHSTNAWVTKSFWNDTVRIGGGGHTKRGLGVRAILWNKFEVTIYPDAKYIDLTREIAFPSNH